VVLLLGRQTAYKRADVIIAAMQQIWPAHPRVRLLVAGAQTAYTAELRRICAALPVMQKDRVTFLTDFAEVDKPAVLAAADLLVQPSQRESFGIVFLEAWAASRPVIGARSGAAPTVISENVDGLLAPYGDGTGRCGKNWAQTAVAKQSRNTVGSR
jgi:glycosyltransferase involved in cell wall biosynthesis